jgi:hypothetical protein
MVDGVLAANQVSAADGPRVRSRLVAALGAADAPAEAAADAAPAVPPTARAA